MAELAGATAKASSFLLVKPHSFHLLPPYPSSVSLFPLSILTRSLTLSGLSSLRLSTSRTKIATQQNTFAVELGEESGEDKINGRPDERSSRVRPCEIFVCNLPRSCDVSQLFDLFKPYGTVDSIEVSRDSVTGLSRGCGYVTMSSDSEARAAISALDGSDLGGREILVKFSAEMVSRRENSIIDTINTSSASCKKDETVYESMYKVYVGNLAWSVRPEDLREHFSQFGTIVSTRVLRDSKGGKHRVFGFVSFASAEERDAALVLNGSIFHGRDFLVRTVTDREQQVA